MPPSPDTANAHGRLVAVGPGLVDVVLGGSAEALLAQLAFVTEHRFRIAVRGDGELAGAHGRIETQFVISADGAVAEHEAVLFIHPQRGGRS